MAHPPLPNAIRQAVIGRYGTEHIHADFAPSRAALLVVDMQNAFLLPEIGYVPCDEAREVLPAINALAAALRAAGGQVVFLKNVHDDELAESWAGMYAMHGQDMARRRAAALSPDASGFALSSELDVEPADWEVVKRRYSAFHPGSSNLEAMLRDRGIETVILTGCTTDVCVESTARDAMMLDFRVIVVEDATAARDDRSHHGALAGLYMHFADVMPAEMVLEHLASA